MTPLVLATIAALCGSLVLLWVYERLYRLDGQRHLLLWLFAWASAPVRYAIILWSQLGGPRPLVIVVEYTLTLLLTLLLLWGTYLFLGRRLPRFWLVIFGATLVWVLAGAVVTFPFAMYALPVFALLGGSKIWLGVVILRSPAFEGRTHGVVGAAFVLLGLHQLDYPLLRPVAWFAPLGYGLAAVLELVIAVGMLLVYFEHTRAGLRQTHEAMQRDLEERKKAEAAAHEQRVLADALRESASALTSALDLQKVLSRILEQLARFVPHDAATIMAVDEGRVRIIGSQGYAERGLAAILEDIQFPVDESSKFLDMIKTGEPLIINDTLSDPQWIDIPANRWVRSYLGAPIRVEGQTIGFVNLDADKPGVFRPEHAHVLRAFTDHAGIALRNARLYEAVRQQAIELEHRVAARTAELARERAQLQAVLDSMGEGVLGVIDGESGESALIWNRALSQLLGDGDAPVLPQEVVKGVAHHLRTARSWKGEMRLQRQDGALFDASLTSARVCAADGRDIGWVTILRDISQEKALEAQKTKFVTQASHELRTPLTNLKTRLYLARRQPDRLDTHLGVMEEVSGHMITLVEDLLDMARLERGAIQLRPEPVELQTLVAGLVEIQQPEAASKQVLLSIHLSPTPLHASVDPARIKQVISNLLSNAILYTPAGGEVQVSVHSGSDHTAVIHIRDTGPGIAAEHLPHIFEPFYRVHDTGNGMGLGLSISREIVELHGGRLVVESASGSGSCFSAHLPLLPAAI